MPDPTDFAEYLEPSRFIDSDHPAIIALAEDVAGTVGDDIARAVRLYYEVRDRIRYNPYAVHREPESHRASATLAAGEGWCVPKAILLAALCRAAGIPARLGFADVCNHLSTERMRQTMQTNIFYFHGYTSIFLEDRWVKATPAFNIELCDKFGLHALEFNGREDSLYQAFDRSGNRHMEYLNERGEFPDLPFEEMMAVFRQHYPALMGEDSGAGQHGANIEARQWDADVARETGTT